MSVLDEDEQIHKKHMFLVYLCAVVSYIGDGAPNVAHRQAVLRKRHAEVEKINQGVLGRFSSMGNELE